MARNLTYSGAFEKTKKKRPGVHAKTKIHEVKTVKIIKNHTEVKVDNLYYLIYNFVFFDFVIFNHI